MKSLLENSFVSLYDVQPSSIVADEEQIQGIATYYDSKSCSETQCISFFRVGCNQETFVVETETPVKALQIEAFLNQVTKIKRERCDLLLYDDNKIVFVDMYCGLGQYLNNHMRDGENVPGKRMKARTQIEQTIELLCKDANVLTEIESKSIREGVLAYRLKENGCFQYIPSTIARNEDPWQRMITMQANRHLSIPLRNGFVYRMVKYPEVYQW